MIIKFIIHKLVTWAAGLKASDFATILTWVASVEDSGKTGASKAQIVTNSIKSKWPALALWAVNLLRELAVSYLNKTVK